MIPTSPNICIYLGRHASAASGLWVYGCSLLQALLSEAAEGRNDFDLECCFGGDARLGEELDEIRKGSKVAFRVKRITSFFSRRLGLLSDLFFHNTRANLIHGTANVLPFFGKAYKVLTLHDLLQAYPQHKPQSLYEYIRCRCYALQTYFMVKAADLIITDLETTKEEILSRYNPKAAIEVIHPGLADVYQEAALPATDLDTKRFLVFASSDKRKNIDKLLRAFKTFNQQKEFSLVVLAGSREVARQVLNQAEGLDLMEAIDIKIALPALDMPALFASCRALLFPSIAEGFGYPIYEALSQGLPVLCNQDNVISELSQYADDALVHCDASSVESIENGLKVISGLELAKERRQDIASYVRSLLDFKKGAAKIIDLYKGFLVE